MKTNRAMTVLIGLQVLTLMSQWLGEPRSNPASAQIANAGAQRDEMIDQLKQINGKLDKLDDVLESGKVQVTTATSDDKKATDK